jgi:microcystin-dependent protein
MPYLTPDSQAGLTTRLLVIPDALLHIVSGQLSYLCNEWIWERGGDMTVGDCVTACQAMLDAYYNGGSMLLGAVLPWAGDVNELPDYYLLCDGTVYNRVDYPALYALLAAAYIDSADTFHTPELVDRFIMGTEENQGFEGGEAEHTLVVDELPAHSHTIPYQSCFPYGEIPEVCVVGGLLTQQTGETGGGLAHNNIPPYHAMVYVMVAK